MFVKTMKRFMSLCLNDITTTSNIDSGAIYLSRDPSFRGLAFDIIVVRSIARSVIKSKFMILTTRQTWR